ncbi:MAG: beta-glucosidase [Geminocystis sp.]|nr:beta-glucosidase [Geminocystis sp.]MCS7146681.1 beta-glucosidase [Geminocystis sp.]MDW8115507.1 glycoside hydrolase family 3 N-terminal domain-containing protein [Geminocystis sp.]MDW8463049.1 glycoside hydrolase family 3 N-terminal domain-containing protein [Geminocystis sp.]
MSGLSLREKIGQLIVVRTTGHLFDHQRCYPAWEASRKQLEEWLGNLNIGGVILLGGSVAEVSYRSQQLQSWAKTPLLIAADIEEGVGQRFTGATWFPPPMALSAIYEKNPAEAEALAEEMGRVTAKEALSIGINWILAPVTDVNNNPSNPVINVRAFGEKTETVSALAPAFVRGCKQYPILTCAKHFPGHGDTSCDSHLDLPVIKHSLPRLQTVELPPFARVIKQGVDSVMTGHLLVEAIDANHPATVSQRVLTGILRQQMGFEGLVVTDALIMAGIQKYAPPAQVAVQALQAGADILLMPPNPLDTIEAVERAVEEGVLSESRIDLSLARVALAKDKIGHPDSSSLSLETIAEEADSRLVEEILKLSMEKGGNFPLPPTSGGVNLIVVEDLLNCSFLARHTAAVAIPRSFGYQCQLVSESDLYYSDYKNTPVLLQVFKRGNPFRGRAGLTPREEEFYRRLFRQPTFQGLVIYGSPYLCQWFCQHLPPSSPWVFTYGQMPLAQQLAMSCLFHLSGDFDLPTDNFL